MRISGSYDKLRLVYCNKCNNIINIIIFEKKKKKKKYYI